MCNELTLDDTFDLIKIFDVLESGTLPDAERIRVATVYLEDFIARRGFDENPLNLNTDKLKIELDHKATCVTCQTSYSWQMCNTLRRELEK
jgi:hypothetical protein